MADISPKRVRGFIGQDGFEAGVMCGALYLLFVALYIMVGFELTVISMLTVVIVGLAQV